MIQPPRLGRRPILSEPTDVLPAELQEAAMSGMAKFGFKIRTVLVDRVSPGFSVSDQVVKTAIRWKGCGTLLSERFVNSASADVLDRETSEALRNPCQRQKKLKSLLGLNTPITLASARLIFKEAKEQGVECDNDLWAAIRSSSEYSADEEESLKELIHSELDQDFIDQFKELDEICEGQTSRKTNSISILKNVTAEGQRNSLHRVVDQVRDVGYVDRLILCGMEIDKKDSKGKTAIDIAVSNGDYFLAAKLQLALNYQLQCDAGDDTQKCCIAGFQFHEDKMSAEKARQNFFEALQSSEQKYTHGFLICHHHDGRITMKLVHASCPVKDDTVLSMLYGNNFDDCKKRFDDMRHKHSLLTRESLHKDVPNSFVEIENTSQKIAKEGWGSLGGRVTWGIARGLAASGLSLLVDGRGGLITPFLVGASSGVAHTSDPAINATMIIGQGVGAATGMYLYGAPMAGLHIGEMVARIADGVGSYGATGKVISCMPNAIGEEFKSSSGPLGGFIYIGSALCVITTVGLKVVSEDLMRWFYILTGGVLTVCVLNKIWRENPKFKWMVLLALSPVAVLAPASYFGYFSAAVTGTKMLNAVAYAASSFRAVQALTCLTGVVYNNDCDPRKLWSIAKSAGFLLKRGIDKVTCRKRKRDYEEELSPPNLPMNTVPSEKRARLEFPSLGLRTAKKLKVDGENDFSHHRRQLSEIGNEEPNLLIKAVVLESENSSSGGEPAEETRKQKIKKKRKKRKRY